MSKPMKILKLIVITIMVACLFEGQKVFAIESNSLIQEKEYSEEYKKWLELSEEEQNATIQPRMYDVSPSNVASKNLFLKAKLLGAGVEKSFNLKDSIPTNLAIRNQESTHLCWAIASLSALETNLALANLKNNTNTSKVYDYSERHMEYASSKYFAGNTQNPAGYNRNVGEGGDWIYAESYLTNGIGAVDESSMPFVNNENLVNISEIQNKTVTSRVYDTIDFPNYNKQTSEVKLQIMNQIKEHIKNYGSVYCSIHGDLASSTGLSCYDDSNGAKYCSNESTHIADHAVAIIGWNDDYSVDNFKDEAQPSSKGAWIARNSWGTEHGDNGLMYISYEDCNVGNGLFGIIKATDTVDYDNIYQYDEYFSIYQLGWNIKNTILCNVFDKKTSGTEFLKGVSLYAPETYTCKVYVNPNGTSKAKADMKEVKLKVGETKTIEAGYHTLEFDKPIEITGNSFVVAIEIEGEKDNITIKLETQSQVQNMFDNVTTQSEKCFIASSNDFNTCQWYDLGNLSNLDASLPNGDSTIKAFTVFEDDSLKNIEIKIPPTKTTYIEGQDFDKTGMVVQANYNDNTYKVLEDTEYNIIDGTDLKLGQNKITITYDDASTEQTISVEENTVTSIAITTPPAKTQYIEGHNFESEGMVLQATYKNGTKQTISGYKVENGSNLTVGEQQIEITYDGKKAYQTITVKPNELLSIEIAKQPDKIKYIVGQSFDKAGMIVKGNYEDGLKQEILGYTVEDAEDLTIGKTSVTIKYNNLTIFQPITVEEKVITEIIISTNPIKTEYIQWQGDLDLSGGILTANYNDGTNETIALTSELINATGFDNTVLGKNTVTITYGSKSTSIDVTIIEEAKPQNSNLDNVTCNINGVKYYTYSDKSRKDKVAIDVTMNGIAKYNENDGYEYYYYLSSSSNETDIENWTEIIDKQATNDKLEFIINTDDIKNYESIKDADELYLYIKEVAIKNQKQSATVSKAMKIESTDKIELYLDDVKVENTSSKEEDENTNEEKDKTTYKASDESKKDKTTSAKILPNTGNKTILVLIVIISIIGIAVYIRYKNLSKYIK